MDGNMVSQYLEVIRREISPAMGCTEPAAVALCAAGAAAQLGEPALRVEVQVSEYILKNGINVGIPGVGAIGLPIAAAMGAVCAKPEKELQVLSGLTETEKTLARQMVEKDRIIISLAAEPDKIYIRARAVSQNHEGVAVIRGSHGNFVRLERDGSALLDRDTPGSQGEPSAPAAESNPDMTVASIWQFVREVPVEELAFLDELIHLNGEIAKEGLAGKYGLQVGRSMQETFSKGLISGDIANYAVAVTAAAADARMSGCEKSVMSVAGSGNQGLTASLPIIAVAEKTGYQREKTYRALALSALITIHTKRYIGRLSVLCGCAISAAIGVSAGTVYLFDGGLSQVELAIKTMTADISGMVCDGAKPGCALKVATSVSAAMRAATLAFSGLGATNHDGIVDMDVEKTLQNLGELGNEGMVGANTAILEMLLSKSKQQPAAE
ncbi:MAG: serine dehydratase subunit alpha family protein [Oscillospiraceae bacterium]